MSRPLNESKPVVSGKPGLTDWELQPVADGEAGLHTVHSPKGSPGRKTAPIRPRKPYKNGAVQAIELGLNGLLLLCALIVGVSWFQRDRIPAPDKLLPDLTQAPVQSPLEDSPFRFSYRQREYEVKTFAAYELWGVIVSHNNITGLADIYHTDDSLDTKDICVIWGSNVERDDYLKARFSSGAWTCNYEYPQGVSLNTNEVANNHLITDNDEIRRTIAGLRRGDQVHMRGRLVGYRDMKWPDNFWRNSSLIRTDSGNGACEVVFVDEINVLKPGNPRWRKAYLVTGIAGLMLLAIRTVFLMAYLFKPADERLSRFARKAK